MRSKIDPSLGRLTVTVGLPPGEVSGAVAATGGEDAADPGCATSSRSGVEDPEVFAVTIVNLSALVLQRQGSDAPDLRCIRRGDMGTRPVDNQLRSPSR
jgi:hypothetical protein